MDEKEFEKMGTVTGFSDGHVEPGHCVIVLGGEVIYVGPLEGSVVCDGAKVFVNPADYARLNAFYKKRLN